MPKRTAIICSVAFTLITFPFFAFAYDDATTHPALTQEILEYYAGTPGAEPLSAQEKEWIIEGSRLEDTPPRWLNHFYDPIHKTGWTGAHAGSLTPQQAIDAGKAGFGMPDPLPAPTWATDFRTQIMYGLYGGDHTLHAAMEAWIHDDKKGAYETLGYLLHLLEDLGVPEHTRDDTHMGQLGDPKSPYEEYAKRWTQDSIKNLKITDSIKEKGISLPNCRTAEDCFEPLAVYSNKYFFSADTINDPRFKFPAIFKETMPYAIGVDEEGKEIPLAMVDISRDGKKYLNTYSLGNDIKYDPIFNGYFSRLSRQVVLHGAAFVRFFTEEAKSQYETRDIRPLYSINWDFITPKGFSLLGWGRQVADAASTGYAATMSTLSLAYNSAAHSIGSVWNAGVGTFARGWRYVAGTSTGGDTEEISLQGRENATSSSSPFGQIAGQRIQRPPQLLNAASPPASSTTGVAEAVVQRVIDGDTIVLADGRHVRYVGMDAPELADGAADTADCYANEAKDRNKELVEGKNVVLEKANQDIDDYGRLVRYVSVEGALVNEILVAEGYASAYDFGFAHPLKKEFSAAEKKAKELKLGIWSEDCKKGKKKTEDDAPKTATSSSAHATTSPFRINEVATAGKEFVELINTGELPADVSGLWIAYYPPSRRSFSDLYRAKPLPAARVGGRERYVVGFGSGIPGVQFEAYASGILGNDAGTLALFVGDPSGGGVYVDAVGWGNTNLYEKRASPAPPPAGAIGRREGATAFDTDDNKEDFVASYTRTPGEKNILLVSASSVGGGSGSPIPAGDAPNIEISEIMYDPRGADGGHEWIEIVNRGSTAADITKIKLFESGSKHSIAAERAPAILPGGAFAIVCEDVPVCAADLSAFGYSGPLFDSAFSLSNSGETIQLLWGDAVLSTAAWTGKEGAGGNGKSLQKIANMWKASAPTPGRENEYVSTQNSIPVAALSAVVAYAGMESSFDGASSTDAEGDIGEWQWDFGDGAAATGTKVAHAYAETGEYTVSLVVTDADGATSTATSAIDVGYAPEDTTGARADHVVISEVQLAGADAGDEFVELYNPSSSTVDISGWSIQYAGAQSSSFSKKNFSDGARIPALGFFLIARASDSDGSDGYKGAKIPDIMHRSFSLSSGSSGGRIFLVSHQNSLASSSMNGIIDSLNYSFRIPSAGQSLERKAFNTKGCVSPLLGAQGEFLGNACVHPREKDDFVVRSAPSPQNSSSLPEPRERPTTPAPVPGQSLAKYASSTMDITFAWVSSNSTGTVYTLRDTSKSPAVFIASTTQTNYRMSVGEVGRPYDFSLIAADADGYSSEEATASVSVASFLSRVDFYKDPAVNAGTIDLFYDAYPFIPDIWSRSVQPRSWQAVVFYADGPARSDTVQLTTTGAHDVQNLEGVLRVRSDKAPYGTLVFGLQPSASIGYGPGLHGSTFLLPEEDGHLRWRLPEPFSYAAGDYVTAAYYDFYRTEGGEQILKLVATDATHFPYLPGVPQRAAPTTPGSFRVEFDGFSSKASLEWATTTDADSEDAKIRYETGIATTTNENALVWTGAQSEMGHVYDVEYPNSYVFAVRAVDTDGISSAVATTTWSFPVGYSPILKTGLTNALSQEFRVATTSNLSEIRIFSPDIYVVSGNGYSVCDVALYEVTSTGAVLITNADTPNAGDGYSGAYAHRGNGCVGLPVSFTYAAHPLLEAGNLYRWHFSLGGGQWPFHTQTFSGIGTDKAGGEVRIDRPYDGGTPAAHSPGGGILNAAFSLMGADGSMIYEWDK